MKAKYKSGAQNTARKEHERDHANKILYNNGKQTLKQRDGKNRGSAQGTTPQGPNADSKASRSPTATRDIIVHKERKFSGVPGNISSADQHAGKKSGLEGDLSDTTPHGDHINEDISQFLQTKQSFNKSSLDGS